MSSKLPHEKNIELATLIRPLAVLPEDRFIKALQMLEKLRHDPAVKVAMDELRPRMAVVRPPRPESLERLVYLAVEDLLPDHSDRKFGGVISRKAMKRVWSFLRQNTDPGILRDWQSEVEAAAKLDLHAGELLQNQIWNWAGREIRAAITASRIDKNARRALLDEDLNLLPEIELTALMLEMSPQLRRLRALVPERGIGSLTKDQRAGVRYILLDAPADAIDHLFGVLTLVMSRYALPSEFFKELPALLFGFSSQTKSALQTRLGDLIMGELDHRTTRVVALSQAGLAERVETTRKLIVTLKAGEQKTAPGDKDGRRQLALARDTATAQIVDIARAADAAVEYAFALDGIDDEESLARCEEGVAALRECRHLARQIGANAGVDQAHDKVVMLLRDSIQSILDQLASGNQAPEKISILQEEFTWLLRLLELSGNKEEADTLRRRSITAFIPALHL